MAEAFEPIAPTASYFDILGVPVAADEATLTRRFHELSRRYHPDRWATADADIQTAALESSALVNDAFRTLRDPFARAEYLLRRERGAKPDDLKDASKPPQELFAQVLEVQEALMEFQEAKMDDDEPAMARVRPALAEVKVGFDTAYSGMADRLRTLFTRWDAGENREAVLDGIASVVGTRGYLRRVLASLNSALES